MNNSALQRVHTIVSEMNSQVYNEGIKYEQDRILELLDKKRATLEDKAVYSVLDAEKNEYYLNRISDLDAIVRLIKGENK